MNLADYMKLKAEQQGVSQQSSAVAMANSQPLNANSAIIGREQSGKPIYDPVIEAGLKAQITQQKEVGTQAQKDVATMNTKRQIYNKDLVSFFAVDDVLHQARGKGLGRVEAGMKMFVEGKTQDSTLGRAVAMHDAAKKRLRVQLVRAAGDVGNLNIVEQKAAELLVPGKFDDYGTAELKRAYLKDVGKAVDANDESLVKELIAKWQSEDAFKGQMTTIKDKEGNSYTIPKESVSDFKKDMGIK